MNCSKSVSDLYKWKQSLFGILVFVLVWVSLAVGIQLVSINNTLGADYYIYYTAARMYITDGANPYTDEVAQTVQIDIMGRLAKPDEDQLAFAYPFFMLFLVIPFAWLDISISQALWMSLNILASITILHKVFDKSRFLGLLVFSTYPVFMGIILGNFSILICFFLLLFFNQILFTEREKISQIMLGMLLALTLGKPQLTWLIVLFALLMSFRKRYYFLILSFLISSVTILIICFALMPNWLNNWLLQIQKYAEYNHNTPAYILTTLLSRFGIFSDLIFGILLIVALFILTLWFVSENRLKDDQIILHNRIIFLNLILILSVFLMPSTLSYNQLPILIGIIIGSKHFITFNPKWIPVIWIFYSITSWLVLVIPKINGLSNSDVIFPLSISFSWIFLLWIFSKHYWMRLRNAPS